MAAPAMHGCERYETVREIGSGGHGVAMLMRDRLTSQLVAFKYIERGAKIDEKVVQEITNHWLLRHPNIVKFKEVILTPTHLAIVMEYVAGGELFHRIFKAGMLNEDEARYFFQQIISGVGYCHSMEVCHRDLKPENLLLDVGPYPLLKICDFGYSKSLVHFLTKSTVGTLPCAAPEVFLEKHYNGKMADIWSCGVTLYVMLVGAYPFVDPKDPTNVRETFKRISSVQYSIPGHIHISPECCHLISRIFVANPALRITIPEIQRHEWFLKNLPAYLVDAHSLNSYIQQSDQPMQSIDQILQIIREARIPGVRGPHQYLMDDYKDCDTEDEEYASEDLEYATESDD